MTGISMVGSSDILHFLNIYFVSPKFAKAIERSGNGAMLHFVYNSDVGCE
jgi:hypothetical protein